MRPVGVADLQAIGVLDDLCRLAAEVDIDAIVRHLLGDPLAEVGVEAAQQALAAIRERRAYAEAVQDRGELERDVAAAHDQRALGQALEMECFVRRDGVLAPFDRRYHRPGAGGDQDVLRAGAPPAHFYGVRIDEGGASAYDSNADGAQQSLVDGVESRYLLVLVGEQRPPVELRPRCRPAVGLGDLEFLAPVGRVGEELLRDAADVDAGAAEKARFGDGDCRAIARRDAARAYAARAAAYREEIEIEAYFRFLRLSSTSSRSMVMRWCSGLSASQRSAFFTRVSISAFGMPSTPANIVASSPSFAACAALRTSASLRSIALRSRFVTIFTVLSSDMGLCLVTRPFAIL